MTPTLTFALLAGGSILLTTGLAIAFEMPRRRRWGSKELTGWSGRAFVAAMVVLIAMLPPLFYQAIGTAVLGHAPLPEGLVDNASLAAMVFAAAMFGVIGWCERTPRSQEVPIGWDTRRELIFESSRLATIASLVLGSFCVVTIHLAFVFESAVLVSTSMLGIPPMSIAIGMLARRLSRSSYVCVLVPLAFATTMVSAVQLIMARGGAGPEYEAPLTLLYLIFGVGGGLLGTLAAPNAADGRP